MLYKIEIERFKGIRRISLEFKGNTLVLGENGSGKTSICELVHLIQALGRGMSVAGVRFATWCDAPSLATRIRIGIKGSRGTDFEYEFSVRQIGLTAKVFEERLLADGQVVMDRDGGRFTYGNGMQRLGDASFPIQPDLLALSLFRGGSTVDCFSEFKSAIMAILCLSSEHLNIDRFISETRITPDVGERAVGWLEKIGSDISGFSMRRDNLGNPVLWLNFCRRQLPSELASHGEKVALLFALVCSLNERLPLTVLWDGPSIGVSEQMSRKMMRYLFDAFRTGGQMLVFSSPGHAVDNLMWQRIRLERVGE